ncbi:MAG: acylphosphatase [bacterium]|nr:acylphosphatase [bacterium]
MTENIRVKLIVQGRVQGVGYRAFAEDLAHQYKIRGYARNLSSGDVEIAAEGDRNNIESFINELWKGPSMAVVRDIIKSEDKYKEEFKGFTIRY